MWLFRQSHIHNLLNVVSLQDEQSETGAFTKSTSRSRGALGRLEPLFCQSLSHLQARGVPSFLLWLEAESKSLPGCCLFKVLCSHSMLQPKRRFFNKVKHYLQTCCLHLHSIVPTREAHWDLFVIDSSYCHSQLRASRKVRYHTPKLKQQCLN